MTSDDLVCKIFGVPDSNYVSKRALIKIVAYMFLEIFHENPDHDLFKNIPKAILSGLRIARVKRITERAETWKRQSG